MFPFSSRARQRKAFGEALYQACVTHARTPELYRELNVPDTPEGRFEMISLHMAILIERLNQEGEVGRAAAQEAFDAMFRDFDGALREMAVGDLSPRKSRRWPRPSTRVSMPICLRWSVGMKPDSQK